MNEQLLLEAVDLLKTTAPHVIEAARSAVEIEISLMRMVGWIVLGIGLGGAVLEIRFDTYSKWGFAALIFSFAAIISVALFITAWYNTHTFEWQVINKIMHGG